MNRRVFLIAAGTALSAAVSGCQDDSEFTSHPEDIRLTRLDYLNFDPKSYNLHVLLLRDGEPVYWRSRETQSADTRDDGTFSGYPTEPAPYELYARLGEDSRSEWQMTDFRTDMRVAGDPDYVCYHVRLTIRDGHLQLARSVDNDSEAC